MKDVFQDFQATKKSTGASVRVQEILPSDEKGQDIWWHYQLKEGSSRNDVDPCKAAWDLWHKRFWDCFR